MLQVGMRRVKGKGRDVTETKTGIDGTREHSSSISGNDEMVLGGWKPVRTSEFMTSQLKWIIPYKWNFQKGQTTKNLSPLHADGRMEK